VSELLPSPRATCRSKEKEKKEKCRGNFVKKKKIKVIFLSHILFD
jgi:hypothetical protein